MGGSPPTMTEGSIKIRQARQNNLAGVDVDLPRNALVAITGLSGSGKSSLAFDTLFREGQRRFLETLSAYARQFLGRMEKPDVESIEGLSPAIAVDQAATARGQRSTVGTLTEIYDHLRVLYARAGTARCPDHGIGLETQTSEGIVRSILGERAGEATLVMAPLIRDRKGAHRALFEELQRKGFVRARVDGEVHRLEDVPDLHRYKRHTIEVVVDRLKPEADSDTSLTRLREAVEQALDLSEGEVTVTGPSGDRNYATSGTCPQCDYEAPPMEPRLFSFNSPHGSCEDCEGLGERRRPSQARVIADPEKSIREGALAVTRKNGAGISYPWCSWEFLGKVARSQGFSLDTPWKDLDDAARKVMLRGAGSARYDDTMSWNGARFQGSVKRQRKFEGVMPSLTRAAKRGNKGARPYLATQVCKSCKGSRLRHEARHVFLGDVGLAELVELPVGELPGLLDKLPLDDREARIARDLLVEIQRRLEFLVQVGLDYLTLSRSADTLSGGEAQRIRLAAQLGSALQGVLYVLDEPSIGLHARDHGRLLEALRSLRDAGNTVIVVEHDEGTLRAADWLVDVGPGPGVHGGKIVGQGPPEEVAACDSPTGRMLRGEIPMPVPDERREGNGNELRIHGARGFNLKNVDVGFPLGTLCVLSGVSGSGKSTLLDRILCRSLERHLGRECADAADHDRVTGLEHVGDLVHIDARPIGRTPRSNPATYTGVMTPMRDLFASLPEARMRGYEKGRFSFNVAGGRCEACGGAGSTLIELQFLAPVTVPCEECGGRRFNAETLEIRYKGKSIADVLELTIEEASEVFENHPKISRTLAMLCEIGVGYLTLGQPSTTLSGGEAQRIKLATYLQKKPRLHTVYVLDEPTTGLHQEDVQRMLAGLQRLVDRGQSVFVIEHNLDVVRAADWVIDLGPEGGSGGGRVLAEGTPEAIEACAESPTGRALIELRAERGESPSGEAATTESKPKGRRKKAARKAPARSLRSGRGAALESVTLEAVPRKGRVVVGGRGPKGTAPLQEIRVEGARTHNLRNIDVSIPRDALTVITGPSGSGKSSLALDTLYTEGRRRFVESLSTYARQFLGAGDRPPVDHIRGLGPAVAVEARTSRGHPRSTVATTTEIHDHLRVLYSRAGVRRCPDHGEKLEPESPSRIARRLAKEHEGAKGWIVAPAFGDGAASLPKTVALWKERVQAWLAAGFVRLLIDGKEERLEAELKKPKAKARVDLVIDRVSFEASGRSRMAEAAEQASALAQGRVGIVIRGPGGVAGERLSFHTQGACSQCGFALEEALEPRHFSFNTHVGACKSCDGLGELKRCMAELLVTEPEKPLVQGAIGSKLGRYLTKGKGFYEFLLRHVAQEHGIDINQPYDKLKKRERDLIMYGRGAKKEYAVEIEKSYRNADVEERFSAEWPGLCGQVDAWHQRTEDPDWAKLLETVMERATCTLCEGERLRSDSRVVTVGRQRLPELLRDSVDAVLLTLDKLKLKADLQEAVAPVLLEIRSRLSLLHRVGLGYLTLDRNTSTLSGGEARRVRLSASLGSQLVGVCYVLDEPTVGLHPGDVDRLTDALCSLRDGGNTVIVVEHDETLMERADYIVDIGPGAGRLGGHVVASGTPAQVAAHKESKTGAALRGELELSRGPRKGRRGRESVGLRGARLHNLKGVDFHANFGELTGVCGPSGSGKSTLILDVFVPALRGEADEGRWRTLDMPPGGAPRTVVVDASPLGRTPASVPATYAGVLDPLRDLFTRTPDARVRGYGPAHFSFNSTKGRCQACDGRGATKVEMQFLADLWLTCEECNGRRYAPEVQEVRFRGKSIADVLEMSISEAREFLAQQPRIEPILKTLEDVGLGYLALGQSSTTLSGGEAQRVKLASELFSAEQASRSVLILDEPSTGLHASDVTHLATVLDRLVDRGHAVILIEHHTGLLGICDQLVELGPAGGEAGGRVIATGSPGELRKDPNSVTGPWLGGKKRPPKASTKKKKRTPKLSTAGRGKGDA